MHETDLREVLHVKKIALYGKGGIGKSTVASNVSAALAHAGYTVVQIGCDPKSDSTQSLTDGKRIPTVLDVMRTKTSPALEDVIVQSRSGVYCIEAGGPIPGTGCAGRGIITAFELLDELGAFELLKPDLVLYDVLGDVVCGGFAMPIRQGYADEVCIVTSGEMMSLYAASNIAHAVKSFGKRKYASLRGLIFNRKGFPGEEASLYKAAEEMETRVILTIPRSEVVHEAEAAGKTVVEYTPDHPQSMVYRDLALSFLEEQP